MDLLFLWKTKKGITITNGFQKILKESNHKPNKIWVDKGSQFYDRSMKSWIKNKWHKNYWTRNKGKSVIAERFIRNLKNKVHKSQNSISKYVYIDEYNNTYHRTIRLKTVDVKSYTCIDSSKEIKDPKLKIGGIIKISKHKTIFQKAISQIGLKVF